MKQPHYWQPVPRKVVKDLLPQLTWQRLGAKSAARDTAALMLYVALLFAHEEEYDEIDLLGVPTNVLVRIARTTYDELAHATGLSRSLISQGLDRLEELGVIRSRGSHQQRCYELVWSTDGFFKLPCRSIVQRGEIRPFTTFKLRSKHELHAMKLYLYLASVIGRGQTYAEASYETIHERIGVSERDIRRAISVLLGTGLLRSVDRNSAEQNTGWGPNRYYLAGDRDLIRTATPRPAEEAVPA